MLDDLAFVSFRHRQLGTRPVMTACRLSASKKATFDEAEHIAAADDDVLGGFQECQPYLHFKEGD